MARVKLDAGELREIASILRELRDVLVEFRKLEGEGVIRVKRGARSGSS